MNNGALQNRILYRSVEDNEREGALSTIKDEAGLNSGRCATVKIDVTDKRRGKEHAGKSV